MGYLSTDIARIPATGFDWYVFMLEDSWEDDLRREFHYHFKNLSREVGPEALVVIGDKPNDFFFQVFTRYSIYLKGYDGQRFPRPALLITDTSPQAIIDEPEILENAKILIFPIEEKYLRPGSITNFLRDLCYALQDPESFQALEELNDQTIYEKWGWISRYFELKPNFYGFGVDLNSILDNLMQKE
ncbi:unnamed protein product [marine sediment metagenome]|uniref:Uncharacterized protein n=1 Tax=marine sediment metagenome TaxID=412755 RepID=X1BSA7_9ZZZZ